VAAVNPASTFNLDRQHRGRPCEIESPTAWRSEAVLSLRLPLPSPPAFRLPSASVALLLPERPARDMENLQTSLKIGIICKSGRTFSDNCQGECVP
jgi:hypothetical protein